MALMALVPDENTGTKAIIDKNLFESANASYTKFWQRDGRTGNPPPEDVIITDINRATQLIMENDNTTITAVAENPNEERVLFELAYTHMSDFVIGGEE